MNAAPPRATPLQPLLLALVAGAIAFRFWTSLCFVPFAEWNDVRLAPTFMLAHGVTPYPGLNHGALTTWTYGPIPLLVNLPVLLARDAIGALLIGGVITLLCAVLPLAFAIFALRLPSLTVSRTARFWALGLCLAFWPNGSLQYIQSDNCAVAFGLVSCVLLARAEGRLGRHLAAALCAALAVWSKQTSLGLVPAQLLWLFLTAGLAVSLRYTLICAVFGLGLGALFVAWFGFDGLWLNLVALPGRFPFAPDLLKRTEELWMPLLGYVALPVAGVVAGRRALFTRTSPWLLPVLVWLFLLPTALLSFYGNGGSSNSLNNVLSLFPLAARSAVAWVQQRTPRLAPTWLAATAAAVTLQQLSFSPLLPVRPLTAHLVIGDALARKYPGQIYFPWNPLLTFFAEGKFYHTEDGLTVRKVSGAARSREALARDLPPTWSLTAIPGWRDYYGVYKELQPPAAQLGYVDRWSVYTWKNPVAAAPK
jgi:hypothetical protein